MQGGYFMEKRLNTQSLCSTQEIRKYQKKSNSQLLALSVVNFLVRIFLLLLLVAAVAGFCFLTSNGHFYEHELLYFFSIAIVLILYFSSSHVLACQDELLDEEMKMRNMF